MFFLSSTLYVLLYLMGLKSMHVSTIPFLEWEVFFCCKIPGLAVTGSGVL